MFGQPEFHLEVRNLLQHLRLDETSGKVADVLRDDRMTVEPAMTVRNKVRDRTIDLRAERLAIGRQLTAAVAPPARGAPPEQLFAALGALLHFEPFAAECRTRFFERGDDPFPPRLALTGRPVDGFVQSPVMLHPPVP